MSRCPLCAFAWSSWKMRRRRLRFGCRVVVGSRPGCCSSPSAESPPRPPCWTSSSCCCACSSLLSSLFLSSLCAVARVAVCDELCLGQFWATNLRLEKNRQPRKERENGLSDHTHGHTDCAVRMRAAPKVGPATGTGRELGVGPARAPMISPTGVRPRAHSCPRPKASRERIFERPSAFPVSIGHCEGTQFA